MFQLQFYIGLDNLQDLYCLFPGIFAQFQRFLFPHRASTAVKSFSMDYSALSALQFGVWRSRKLPREEAPSPLLDNLVGWIPKDHSSLLIWF